MDIWIPDAPATPAPARPNDGSLPGRLANQPRYYYLVRPNGGGWEVAGAAGESHALASRGDAMARARAEAQRHWEQRGEWSGVKVEGHARTDTWFGP